MLTRNKERERETESSGWNMYEVVYSVVCSAVMMSASERWNTQSSGRERLLWPHDGWGMLRGYISYSSAPPLLRLIISPRAAQTPPTWVGPPGSYVTCILILPSDITKATSSQLQLIVSLIDDAADYLCDSLASFHLCNKVVKKKCCSL